MISMARTLGAPLTVPAGKLALQHGDGIQPGFELAFDVGDDVHDVGVALDGHALGHAHAPDLRHAADVVAAEIHQHDVLGPLLRIGQQVLLQRDILLARAASRTRPGNGPQRDGVALQPHQDLRRSTHDMEIAHVEIEHVWRRIERPKRAIQRQRRGGIRVADALRQHHLHDVAVVDVALGSFHRLYERILAELMLDGTGRHRCLFRHLDGLAQLRRQLLQPRLRTLKSIRLAWIGKDDEIQLAGQVIDDGQLLRQQQQDIRGIERIRLGGFGDARLDVAHRVVAQKTRPDRRRTAAGPKATPP